MTTLPRAPGAARDRAAAGEQQPFPTNGGSLIIRVSGTGYHAAGGANTHLTLPTLTHTVTLPPSTYYARITASSLLADENDRYDIVVEELPF